ncbi:hypothetical protein Smp_126210 [Schistosoma mansoni]|uniref:hypothetical protein n=1 Tax=Schistosoma mansoni TaxID=6183 RepID=UPI0001A63E19|nr:hypothetical protein Smp_126210 [Schistosoma mansoni]|eukprot:XP_018646840.1 hypothetical protein Smp_126210 [Schistosoma mansoni]
MRNGQGKEVASASVMIKKYVKLDPDDEFNSQTLIKRHGEQLKNKHKPSKWCRLHITNDELWLSGAYWWPNSILNGIHLSEINCLVKFYSTPNLLAIGIASRLYESEKQYVILCTKSGSDREQLVKTLTTLCGNRYTQSEKRFNVPIVGPTVNIVEISLSPDLKKSVPVGKSIEINHEPKIQLTSNDNMRPYRLKRFMAPYCEGLESGLNPKDLIHVYYDPKQGNIISPDGPIYLYCVNCPTE